jgi:hypothetical protein
MNLGVERLASQRPYQAAHLASGQRLLNLHLDLNGPAR